MNPFTKLYTHLQSNPHLGVASGFGSGIIYWLRHMLTDELVLKIAAGIGTITGAIVAVLTLIIYLVKVFDIFSDRYKKFKARKNENRNITPGGGGAADPDIL